MQFLLRGHQMEPTEGRPRAPGEAHSRDRKLSPGGHFAAAQRLMLAKKSLVEATERWHQWDLNGDISDLGKP